MYHSAVAPGDLFWSLPFIPLHGFNMPLPTVDIQAPLHWWVGPPGGTKGAGGGVAGGWVVRCTSMEGDEEHPCSPLSSPRPGWLERGHPASVILSSLGPHRPWSMSPQIPRGPGPAGRQGWERKSNLWRFVSFSPVCGKSTPVKEVRRKQGPTPNLPWLSIMACKTQITWNHPWSRAPLIPSTPNTIQNKGG